MRVFMVHEDPWHSGSPYITTFMDTLGSTHPDCEMGWGRERFWSDDIFTFDIVHFHYPSAFISYDTHNESDLLHHIERMKSAGVKVVATCHDLEPHYDQCSAKGEAMRIVYSHCDAVFHMGAYSKELFEQRYPQATHFLLPHHLYETVYRFFPSREESLRHLHLSADRTYILCFGMFRADEERQLVINLYRQLNDKKVVILAPGFLDVWIRSPKLFVRLAKMLYYRCRYHIHSKGKAWGAVSDDDLPYYYGAADVAFIQRLKILNSGNAMLPMLFGRVVVGPDCGNVGPLLRRWGYPVFNVDDTSHIGDTVRRAIELGRQGYGTVHREEQLAEYSTAVISEQLYVLYHRLL